MYTELTTLTATLTKWLKRVERSYELSSAVGRYVAPDFLQTFFNEEEMWEKVILSQITQPIKLTFFCLSNETWN